MASLYDATLPVDGTLTVHDGWRQGRGAYGGLTIAAAIRAIEARVADPLRRLRTLTAELPAPTMPGPATFDVDILRSGSNLTVARAALRQGGTVTAHAVAILAADRDVDLAFCDLTPPTAPPYESLTPIPMTGALWPEFATNFEYRLVAGMPFANTVETTSVGYIRAREPGPARDAAYLAAMIDVWWPALFGRMPRPRPMATIAFTLEIVGDLEGVALDAPLLYRGHVPLARGGYVQEARELWTTDGRLVARNHQTFAIIK